MKKILILEDNVLSADFISSLINEIEIKNAVCVCNNVKDAYQYTLEKDIDLFIIDIILDTNRPGDSSGLTFVDSIRKIERYAFTPVIFVSSLEDSKLYTYEKLHCYSFIEKPFEPVKLKETIVKCLNFSKSEQKNKTLYFRKDGIILAADREDIVYVESINHVLSIHTSQSDTLNIPYITIKKFITDVDSPDFIQCSRNTVVNKKYIQNIDITNRMIQLKNKFGTVEIGIMYKREIRESFK